MKLYKIVLIALLAISCKKENSIKPDPIADVDYNDHPKQTQYQAALHTYKVQTSSPGSILLVSRENERLWIGSDGFSNLEYNTVMRKNHQFRAASITKMFTSVVIMQFVQEGKLSLDAKLSSFVPNLSKYIDNSSAITIRHLLANLSGIPDPVNESIEYQTDILNHPEEMAKLSVEAKIKKYLSGKPLKFSPGSEYSYSNTNFLLLGAIAEELGGKTLNALFNERIYTPLGLKNTYLEIRDDKNVSRSYADIFQNGQVMDVTLFDKAEGDAEADGGLITTAEDLFLFMKGLFNGQLVSPLLVNEMKRKQLSSCNSTECEYGLGIEIWRTGAGIAYGHNGSLLGVEANTLFYPDKNAIIVLYKNNGNGSDKEFLSELVK
ncbi:MAG: beta-lactamase family protein [Chitinophagaceae bacterium]|uniref:serine hydrolase domain-containing protein n=1 Tax=unclassified Paraflavitalea TaxID=2798305 RepID=UPI003D34EB8C|nr:beta-lactamase family protein [Chitinophagaceae bacterium]